MEQHITSKEKILKKVRQALNQKSKGNFQNIDLESNVYAKPQEDTLSEAFVARFTKAAGQYVYCDNQFDCIDKLLDLIELRKWKYIFCWEEECQQLLDDSGISYFSKRDSLDKIQVSITGCEAIIARTGSILVSSSKNSRVMSIWPPVHLVIARKSQLVADLKDGMQVMRNRYGRKTPSLFSFITGPSRTAQIPAEIRGGKPSWVIGAHGPVELILFFVDDIKKD